MKVFQFTICPKGQYPVDSTIQAEGYIEAKRILDAQYGAHQIRNIIEIDDLGRKEREAESARRVAQARLEEQQRKDAMFPSHSSTPERVESHYTSSSSSSSEDNSALGYLMLAVIIGSWILQALEVAWHWFLTYGVPALIFGTIAGLVYFLFNWSSLLEKIEASNKETGPAPSLDE